MRFQRKRILSPMIWKSTTKWIINKMKRMMRMRRMRRMRRMKRITKWMLNNKMRSIGLWRNWKWKTMILWRSLRKWRRKNKTMTKT